MNGQPSGKNSEVKIDAGQRSETERNGEQVHSFHESNMCSRWLMSRGHPVARFWVAHASRVLASASSRSRTFVDVRNTRDMQAEEKSVSARRRNHHAGGMRYPIRFAADNRGLYNLRHARHSFDSREAGLCSRD